MIFFLRNYNSFKLSTIVRHYYSLHLYIFTPADIPDKVNLQMAILLKIINFSNYAQSHSNLDYQK